MNVERPVCAGSSGAQLADSNLYVGASKERLKELLRDQARVKAEIDEEEEEEAWLEASEWLQTRRR